MITLYAAIDRMADLRGIEWERNSIDENGTSCLVGKLMWSRRSRGLRTRWRHQRCVVTAGGPWVWSIIRRYTAPSMVGRFYICAAPVVRESAAIRRPTSRWAPWLMHLRRKRGEKPMLHSIRFGEGRHRGIDRRRIVR